MSELKNPPRSAADPRPNNEPYYIETDCPDCGEELILNDILVESHEIWHDEWICPDCQDGLYLDRPEETSDMKQKEPQHDGFNVSIEVSLREFAERQFNDSFGEYVHLVPDVKNRELRCYRSISEDGEPNERAKTTIENVTIHPMQGFEAPEHWYLTGMRSKTLLNILGLIGDVDRMEIRWYNEGGGSMMDDEKTSIETLIFRVVTNDGTEHEFQINNEWQSPKAHRMAKIEGERL